MPVLCQFQLAVEALHSVQSQYDWQPFIVDNWSDNRGVAAGWNEGCRQALAARCTHILVINDDVVLTPWTVDALVGLLEQSPETVLVSGVPVNKAPVQPVADSWDIRDGLRQMPKPEAAEITPDSAHFCCFMIKPVTLEQVGWFDEHFFPACFEDTDYIYRIRLSGALAQATTAAPHLHYSSVSQRTVDTRTAVNHGYYQQKWGGPPQKEQYRQPFRDPGKTWKDM